MAHTSEPMILDGTVYVPTSDDAPAFPWLDEEDLIVTDPAQ